MIAISKVWRRSFGILRLNRRRWSAASDRNCHPGCLAEPSCARKCRNLRSGLLRHPGWSSASLPPSHAPSHQDDRRYALHRSGSPDPSASRDVSSHLDQPRLTLPPAQIERSCPGIGKPSLFIFCKASSQRLLPVSEHVRDQPSRVRPRLADLRAYRPRLLWRRLK